MNSPESPSAAPDILPLAFVSAWLLAWYTHVLKPSRQDAGALPLLLKSWWLGPRAVPVPAAQRASTNSYSIALTEDFCCDLLGRSTLLLLEDGRPLPLPHTPSIKSIAAEGRGRWVHMRRKITFAPTDNADLAKAPHQYHLIDGLGRTPERYGALSKLAARRKSYRDPARYALDKMKLMLGERLRFDASDSGAPEQEPPPLILRNIFIDLSPAFLPEMRIEQLQVNAAESKDGIRLQLEAQDFAWAEIRLSTFELDLELSPRFEPRIQALDARYAMQGGLSWHEGKFHLYVQRVADARAFLARMCGGWVQAALWLERMTGDIGNGLLPFAIRMENTDRQRLLATLEDGADDTGLILATYQRDGVTWIKIEIAP